METEIPFLFFSKTENSIVGDAKIATQSIQDEIHKLKDTHQ